MRSETERKLCSISQPVGALMIALVSWLRSPSEATAEKIEECDQQYQAALRDILAEHAPARVQFAPRCRPMTGHDLADTILAVKEAQAITATCISAWLRTPTEAAAERLVKAREQEAELFQVVCAGVNPDRGVGRPKLDGRHNQRRAEHHKREAVG
jgi:hypothetical protein